MSNSDGDENSLHKVHQIPGINSIMEAFDRNLKLEEQDAGDDYTQDSFTEKFLNGGDQDQKHKKMSKKQILDTNSLQLKREFEEQSRKQQNDKTKPQNESELKKLLNDVRCYTKERNKRLENTYTQFQKIVEEEMSIQGTKPSVKNISIKSLQYPQVLDNRNAHSLDVTCMASTEENVIFLQGELAKIKQKSEDLQSELVHQEDKTVSLKTMQNELRKTIDITQEEINGKDDLVVSYQKQIEQADEKIRKYNNDAHGTQVEIQKFQRFIRADSKQKSGFIQDKNKTMDEQKYELKETIGEYKKLQNELDKARCENDKKVDEIKDVNKKLKTKFELMLESRKLIKELDNFDKLTKIFVYGDPSQVDFSELESQLQKSKTFKKQGSQSDLSENDDQNIESYLNNENNENNWNPPSPTYKQGTIITRLRRFYKFHGEDLNSIIDQILKIYYDYNMQNNTLQMRLDDLQEQKRRLDIQWRKLNSQKDGEQSEGKMVQFQDDSTEIELDSPTKPRSNSDIISSKLNKNKINQDDINQLQQFIGHCFLFLNESLFRMVGITSIIRGITNSSDNIKKDEKFQEEYFKNDLYDNLQQMISYSSSNKGYLISQKLKHPEDDIQEHSNFLPLKIIDIQKLFHRYMPEIESKNDKFIEFVKKDFVLLNFCQVDTYQKFFEYFRDKIEKTTFENTHENIWKIFLEKLQNKVGDEGRSLFIKMLNKLLNFIKQLLQRIKTQKGKIENKLMEMNPDSPAFKPSHIRQKLEGKLPKKKDWKDKLAKNKIKQFEQYQGINFEQVKSAQGIVQYLTDLVSQSEAGQQKIEIDNEDEIKYVDQMWHREKTEIGKKAKEHQEIQSKVQEKPKVISKYMEQSKYGLKYSESWKYLVKSKKEFANFVWDSEQENFENKKNHLPKINKDESIDSAKPEHLFSHVMYQQSHPIESKFNSSRIRMNTISMTEQEMSHFKKNSTLPQHNQSHNQLARLRKVSNPHVITESNKTRSRSYMGGNSTTSNGIQKSRLLNSRDENKIMQIKTNSNNKPPRIQTESALAPIKANSQMQ